MREKLVKFAIEAAARRNGGDANYLVALYNASPRVLKSLKAAVNMLSHREVISIDAAYAAQIVGALAEGCGSCVQLHVDMARRAGVPEKDIAAVLHGEETLLLPETSLAMRFARAIASKSDDVPALGDEVRERWGEKGVIDLTMATQVSRFLSMLKTGFGHAIACEAVKVGEHVVRPAAPSRTAAGAP